ncbi:MAG TPA: hypothetical protein VIU34_05730 [Steroidobacter sp.]
MKNAVYGIANTPEQAESIVTRLQSLGIQSSDVSVLFPDKAGTRDFAHEKNTKAPEGATTGGLAGMGVGGALGLLAGIGALAIPGVGPLIAAGPIMAALSGAAVGGATGGLIGALVGLGIPELEAKQYEGKVRAGNILISVHTANGDERARAKQALEESGATDVSSTSEASVPKDSRAAERVVKPDFNGEVTRGSSDASDRNAADEADRAVASTKSARSTISTNSPRRPQ